MRCYDLPEPDFPKSMQVHRTMRPCSTIRFLTSFLLFFGVTLASAAVVEFSETHTLDSPWTRSWTVEEGDALELSVRIDQPSALLPNSRIEAVWDGPDLPQFTYEEERGEGISATTDWSKVLHAWLQRYPADGPSGGLAINKLRENVQIHFPVTDAWYRDADGNLQPISCDDGIDILTSIKCCLEFDVASDRSSNWIYEGVKLRVLALEDVKMLRSYKISN